MILISHRGNINGVEIDRENTPEYIDEALGLNYDVELDLWYINDEFYLGHDTPQHKISYTWLVSRGDNLWVHCKNPDAIAKLSSIDRETPYLPGLLNYFWHEEDTLTLTSKGHMWVYPGKQPIKNSIAVKPEMYKDDISQCLGVCSDEISKYND